MFLDHKYVSPDSIVVVSSSVCTNWLALWLKPRQSIVTVFPPNYSRPIWPKLRERVMKIRCACTRLWPTVGIVCRQNVMFRWP